MSRESAMPTLSGRDAGRRLRVAAGAVIALVVALLGFVTAAPAQAHNYVVSTNPAADSVVTTQPDVVSITTNDALLNTGAESGANAIQVVGPDGTYYGDGCATIDGATVLMKTELGEPGLYTVVWQTVSADGHPISDEFSFTWQPDAGQSVAEGSAQAPVCGQSQEPGTPIETQSPQTPEQTDATDSTETPASEDGAGAVAIIVGIGIALGVLIIAAVIFFIVQAKRNRGGPDGPAVRRPE